MIMKRLHEFWFHPTIEAMQTQMLRHVWNRRPRLRLLNSVEHAQLEVDRITRLWLPTTKWVIEEFKRTGAFGYRSNNAGNQK